MFIKIQNYFLLSTLVLLTTISSHANDADLNTDITDAEWNDIYSHIYTNYKSIPFTNAAQLDQSYLKASNVDDGDRDGNGDGFGSSVAIDGDTLVIGARFEDGDNDDTLSSGAAYVFVKLNGAWVEQSYLKASDGINGDQFGYSVAISGDTLIVGSHLEDTTQPNSGAVYVFTRTLNVWSEQTILKASNPGVNDNFGYSIDIDGGYIISGARREDGADNGLQNDAGAAYVFTGSGNSWSQQAYLQASNIGEGDNFGVSVAIDNDTIVVGASLEDGADDGMEDDMGAAYVFVRSGTTWSQQGNLLTASNGEAKDNFGISVDISGESVVVGSHLEDGLDNMLESSSGAAYVFTRSSVVWSEQAILKSLNVGAGDLFGNAVAIDGDSVIVGARFEDGDGIGGLDNNLAFNSGAAYLFTRSQNLWTQQSYLKASNADIRDEFGTAVALSGTNLVATAPSEDSAVINDPNDNTFVSNAPPFIVGAGAAYVFTPPDLMFSNGFEEIVVSQ